MHVRDLKNFDDRLGLVVQVEDTDRKLWVQTNKMEVNEDTGDVIIKVILNSKNLRSALNMPDVP